jgi:4-hydroxy-tetrahydrodipicolinate reductase
MKIIVCGAAGRMGHAILRLAKEDKDIEIKAAVEYEGNASIGSGEPKIISATKLETVLSGSEVIIDFTSPESALENLNKARKSKTAVIIGTTGFNSEQKKQIIEISKDIPILLSPNMSAGINFLFKLVELSAKAMPSYDIEIVEAHHNKKKDAPSGTAAKLAEIAAKALEENIDDVAVYERHNVNKSRTKEEIGIMSIRAGDIVGDHTVYFAGPGERIELTHRAHSRDTFAAGAIRAAKWIFQKSANLYDMNDVLGLNKI